MVNTKRIKNNLFAAKLVSKFHATVAKSEKHNTNKMVDKTKSNKDTALSTPEAKTTSLCATRRKK